MSDLSVRKRQYMRAASAVLLVGGVMLSATSVAQAATTDSASGCVKAADAKVTHDVDTDKGTATVSLKSGTLCAGEHLAFSMASYTMPKAAYSVPQTLFDSDSKWVSASNKVAQFAIKVPACFHQVDLIKGGKSAVLKSITAKNVPGKDYTGANFITGAVGGDKSCTGVTPPSSPASPSVQTPTASFSDACDAVTVKLTNPTAKEATFTIVRADDKSHPVTSTVSAGKAYAKKVMGLTGATSMTVKYGSKKIATHDFTPTGCETPTPTPSETTPAPSPSETSPAPSPSDSTPSPKPATTKPAISFTETCDTVTATLTNPTGKAEAFDVDVQDAAGAVVRYGTVPMTAKETSKTVQVKLDDKAVGTKVTVRIQAGSSVSEEHAFTRTECSTPSPKPGVKTPTPTPTPTPSDSTPTPTPSETSPIGQPSTDTASPTPSASTPSVTTPAPSPSASPGVLGVTVKRDCTGMTVSLTNEGTSSNTFTITGPTGVTRYPVAGGHKVDVMIKGNNGQKFTVGGRGVKETLTYETPSNCATNAAPAASPESPGVEGVTHSKPSLPVTGSKIGVQFGIGLGLMLLGALCFGVTRRRRA